MSAHRHRLGLSLAVSLAVSGLVASWLWAAPAPETSRHARAPCTREAPHGKAWVTPLGEGKNAWVGRLELAPRAAVPSHRDSTEEYIHVLFGRGRMTMDGVVFDVGPGDTVVMPANAEVSFQNGDERLAAIQVFAGPGPASKYLSWSGCS